MGHGRLCYDSTVQALAMDYEETTYVIKQNMSDLCELLWSDSFGGIIACQIRFALAASANTAMILQSTIACRLG